MSAKHGSEMSISQTRDSRSGVVRLMQQKGFKAGRKRTQTLGNYQEIRIRQFHQTLDKYLDA